MLPQTTRPPAPPTKTIFINPHFKGCTSVAANDAIHSGAHINPLFLNAHRPQTIHMNPAFLQHPLYGQHNLSVSSQQGPPAPPMPTKSITMEPKSMSGHSRKIITKSRTCIVREPLVDKSDMKHKSNTFTNNNTVQPIVVLSKRKLIRKSATSILESALRKKTQTQTQKASIRIKPAVGQYKVDHRQIQSPPIRPSTLLLKTRRRTYVGRYALRRSVSQPLSKTISSAFPGMNKKLKFLNINGVLYKSTRNSLQRKESASNRPPPLRVGARDCPMNSERPPGLTIYVRGAKYVMDSHKFKLTRVTSGETASLTPTRRIDIGGFTYVAASTNRNVYVRTRNHLSRAYLNNAKQRSLQLLSRRFTKSNVPCAIFQRLGKCAAFENGRCSKVHNKQQVAICPRFLRGECHDDNCLLSHSVSLSKMPVCKFFLQGMCVRNDCPYLHKKLNENAEVCLDFVRGFCKLAEKCKKRHEFVCAEYERTGSCRTANCFYCKNQKRQPPKEKSQKVTVVRQTTEDSLDVNGTKAEDATLRYFNGSSERFSVCELKSTEEENEATVEDSDVRTSFNGRTRRPKVGKLPSFIPLT